MSDTPRTDAIVVRANTELAISLARQLERELAALRADHERIIASWKAEENDWREMNDRLRKRHDEALEVIGQCAAAFRGDFITYNDLKSQRMLTLCEETINAAGRDAPSPAGPATDVGERAITQLAGCLCAAEGWGTVASEGDYGYSVAYEKTLLLRKAFDKIAGGKSPEQILQGDAPDEAQKETISLSAHKAMSNAKKRPALIRKRIE
jgi:hypothetical protein